MANQYLSQFSPKTTPVGADILYLGDSANSFVEAKTTITQIISNNSIVVKSAATSGNLPIWSSSTQIGDSGISVDGSRNVTNIANLTATNVDATIGANTPTTGKFTSVTSSTLTSGQMLSATTNGLIQNSGIAVDTSQNLTNVGNVTGSGTAQFATLKATGLGSGQVVVAGASGVLTGSSAFTLSGNVLSVTASSGIAANIATPKATYHFATGSTIISGTSAVISGNLANNEINPYILGTDLLFNYKTNSGAFYTLDFNNYMLKSANLSDVTNATIAFNNISPLTSKGDIVTCDGTNSIRFPAGSDGYVLSYDSTQPSGLLAIPQSQAAAFVDNAVFIGTAGQGISSATATPLALGTLYESTTGNRWTTNGDGTGMKCGAAGTYIFTGICPLYVQSNTSANYGTVYFRFTKNGTVIGPTCVLAPRSYLDIYTATVTMIITCAVNDVIRFTVASGVSGNPYNIPDPGVTGAVNTACVSICRLT